MAELSVLHFRSLRATLSSLQDTVNGDVDAHQLRLQLDRSRAAFRRILEKVPPSSKEKEELEKASQFTPLGSSSSQAINQEFKHEAIFLSSQLAISGRLAASLLSSALNDHALVSRPGRPYAENAVVLYYEERRDLLLCLELIFSYLLGAPGIYLDPAIRSVLLNFASDLTSHEDPKEGSWSKKLIKEMENQSRAIEEIRSASNTQSQQQGQSRARFNDEINGVRITAHREERRLLATILYYAGSARLLSKADILATVRWIASVKEPAHDPTLPVGLCTVLAILNTSTSHLEQQQQQQLVVRGNKDQGRTRSSSSSISPSLEALFTDAKFVTDLHSFITTKVNWKSVSSIQPVVQLAWCLFLIQAVRFKPSLISETKIWENVIEDCILEAVHSSALQTLGDRVLRFKKPSDPFEELGWNAGTRQELLEDGGSENAFQSPAPEFQHEVVRRVDELVESFITNASSILRKIRHREEDVLMASTLGRTAAGSAGASGGTPSRRRLSASSRRGGDDGSSQTGQHGAQQQEPRHDIEALFNLLATLYRDAPDAALKYWIEDDADGSPEAVHRHSRLSAFLRWAADCRVPSMTRAFFDMLGSLATGERSAGFAFEFLAQNSAAGQDGAGASGSLCSWSSLFDALTFYANQRGANGEHFGPTEIPPEEVTLLKSFLRLLRIVVSSSSVARAALYDNQRYKPVLTLFNLIVQPVPIDLKAALLEAVSAFTASPTASSVALNARNAGMASVAAEIGKRTWMTLESSQILPTIPVRDVRGNILKPQPPGGIVQELEQVESPSKVYPTTTAFVNLLVTLLGGPPAGLSSSSDPGAAADSLEYASAANARPIPDNLGAPHRSPAEGVQAYTKYVVEDVFLQAQTREYRNPGERWRLVERCLSYFERCLLSLSFDRFLSGSTPNDPNNPTLSPVYQLLLDPGFDVLVRILGGTKILEELFNLASVELEVLDNTEAATDTFVLCVLKSLRIIQRVFTLQALFLEVVLPTLLDNPAALPSDKLNRLRSIQPLDQHMLYSSRVVVRIAVLVNTIRSKAIGLTVIRILTFLASSSTFNVTDMFRDVYKTKMNRLAGLVDASDETSRVLDGFVRRLHADPSFDDLSSARADQQDRAASLVRPEDDIDDAIKSAILDLLLQNTQPHSQAPNIAHLLLGCDIRRRGDQLQILDPYGSEVAPSCLHVVMAYLARIHADATGYEDEADESDVPNLLLEKPMLAEKCYRLMRQICLHDYTSQAVTRYLRSTKNFFLHQSYILPIKIAAFGEYSNGQLTYSDGTEISTTASAVTSTLQSQAWLLESLALELNNLVASDQIERALQLLAALYGSQSAMTFEDGDGQTHGGRDGLAQSLPRMVDIFYSLDFSWADAVPLNTTPLSYFASVSFETCIRKQTSGSEIYDFQAVLALLQSKRRTLQSQGVLNTQQQQEAIRAETRMVLENLVIENNRREIQHARFHTLQAWRNVLDITLTRAWNLLPSNGADGLLLDLLASVLPPIGAEDTDAAIQEIFAGAAVLLTTELRQEGIRQQLAAQAQVFSPERLLPILQSTVRAIVQPGVSPVVRGNLYAVLLQYIHHSSASANATSSSSGTVKALPSSFSLSNLGEATLDNGDNSFTLDAASTIGGTKRVVRRNALQSGNLSILQSSMDRLLPIVCLDAASGHEVWQTVAFTMLDALCLVAGEGSAGAKLAAALSKQGYLQAFVSSIKESEADLSDVLRADPDSLNALYVYEAKLSFLTRTAATTEGAEKLLDAQALPKLASCSFLEERPRPNEAAMEFDSFLPPVLQRYHQLVLPALQLGLAIVTSCGAHHVGASRQVQTFLLDQRDAMKTILEEATVAPSLTVLQEAHLLVQLMRAVLPVLSDQELTSPLGFGGLHTSLLGLTSTLLGEQDWIASVQPTNDDEQSEAEQVIPEIRKPTTVFDDKLQTLVESLQLSVLEYQKATTKRSGSTVLRPVWLPSFQLEEGRSKTNIVAPTMRGAFVFLLDVVDILSTRLEDSKELAFKIDNFDDIGIHDLELYEALGGEDEPNLDSQTRRQRILATLYELKSSLRSRILSSLHLAELSLLLIWRHLGYYLDESRQSSHLRSDRPSSKNGVASGLKVQSLRGSLDLGNVKQNAQDAFSLVYERLDGLQIEKEAIGVDARSHEALVATLLRSVLDLLGDRQDP